MANSGESHWMGRHAGKDELRHQIWTALKESGDAIGDPFGWIPNFVGADKAAARLAELPIWKSAGVVKSNPDAPQAHVRLRALQDGKILYMAVPRLAEDRCFIELTAADLLARGIALEDAAQWQIAVEIGKRVAFEEMKLIDLAVTGCVAVTRAGGRTGKGAGFADLEFAMLRQFGLLSPGTPIVTTVHSMMVVENERLPIQPHDTFLNWIITPDETIEVVTAGPQPGGIDWDRIRPDQFETIPVLRKLKPDWSPK
ncbi:MAG: 5-formyltetrahydrofolate cyclo-ligase [Chloroflexi bacterium]|nr:5-formyltetrahydrofolate cyclo-ligase [Chloroflexota bacterium]